MISAEATNSLALRPQLQGVSLYVHPVEVNVGDYTAAENSLPNNIVAPLHGMVSCPHKN